VGLFTFRRQGTREPALIDQIVRVETAPPLSPAVGYDTIGVERTPDSASDQVHACQIMIEVHTVSMVAKNKYSGKAGGRPSPISGGMKVREPLTSARNGQLARGATA
jgi:hypothetical protein